MVANAKPSVPEPITLMFNRSDSGIISSSFYQLGLVTCPRNDQAGRIPTHKCVINTGLIARYAGVDLMLLANLVGTGRPGQKLLNIELVG